MRGRGKSGPRLARGSQACVDRFCSLGGSRALRQKSCMEAAAMDFHLRNVYGLAGTQNYYLSVYLQIGFSQRGAVSLPAWLVGFHSEAIRYLLGVQRTPPMQSESFTQLWHSLREYRHRNIGEEQLRKVVAESPWVLPEWADALVSHARAHPNLSEPRSDASGSTNRLQRDALALV